MKTKKQIELLIVAASILSTSAFAVTTPPTAITKPIIGAASTFALFLIDAKKIRNTPAKELATLTSQLSSYQIKPCTVLKDINYTPITCGAAVVSFGLNQLFSNISPINFTHLPVVFNRGVKQVFAGNFLSPDKTIVGDTTGRLVHVRFKTVVTDFAMQVDAGQSTAASVDRLRYWTVDSAGTRISSVEVSVTAGIPQWAGIHIPEGTQDIEIEALDGFTQAYTIDQISYR